MNLQGFKLSKMINLWPARKPKISVIVITYNMNRALPRTLYSLSQQYQLNVSDSDYEVIVIDNGSEAPLDASVIQSYGSNFHYKVLVNPPSSPAYAVNVGVALAKADKLALLVDGARIVTPGFLHHAIAAFNLYPRTVVATLSWHLGDIPQQLNFSKGYNEEVEDELLLSVDWQSDGYDLFSISCLAPSSRGGCFKPLAESNALVVSVQHYNELGGYDEKFDVPGGGFVNLDFYRRAIKDDETKLVMLAGEASFHQVHGGISTNVEKQEQQKRVNKWREDYEKLRGEPFQIIEKTPFIFGDISRKAIPSILQSIEMLD